MNLSDIDSAQVSNSTMSCDGIGDSRLSHSEDLGPILGPLPPEIGQLDAEVARLVAGFRLLSVEAQHQFLLIVERQAECRSIDG